MINKSQNQVSDNFKNNRIKFRKDFPSSMFLPKYSCFRDSLYKYAGDQWGSCTGEVQRKMARLAAAAAWGLGKWDRMDEYTCMIPREHYDGSLYRAVIAIHNNHFVQAQEVNICCYVLRFFKCLFFTAQLFLTMIYVAKSSKRKIQLM